MPQLWTAIVLTACSFMLVDVAAAQTSRAPTPPPTTTVISPGHWTITPFIGVGFSGDLDNGTGALGAAAGYVWSDRVSLEGELTILPSGETSSVLQVDTKVWTLTGNVLYRFTGRRWVPYGALGIGFGHGSADVNTPTGTLNLQTSSTNFVLNFGGGAERRLNERLALRGDLRYFFGGDLVPDYWRLGGGLSIDLGAR